MMTTTALEYGASAYDVLRFELGLSEEETQEILEELHGGDN